jgi:hypothetical protein
MKIFSCLFVIGLFVSSPVASQAEETQTGFVTFSKNTGGQHLKYLVKKEFRNLLGPESENITLSYSLHYQVFEHDDITIFNPIIEDFVMAVGKDILIDPSEQEILVFGTALEIPYAASLSANQYHISSDIMLAKRCFPYFSNNQTFTMSSTKNLERYLASLNAYSLNHFMDWLAIWYGKTFALNTPVPIDTSDLFFWAEPPRDETSPNGYNLEAPRLFSKGTIFITPSGPDEYSCVLDVVCDIPENPVEMKIECLTNSNLEFSKFSKMTILLRKESDGKPVPFYEVTEAFRSRED